MIKKDYVVARVIIMRLNADGKATPTIDYIFT